MKNEQQCAMERTTVLGHRKGSGMVLVQVCVCVWALGGGAYLKSCLCQFSRVLDQHFCVNQRVGISSKNFNFYLIFA